jgi:site-specific DNA-methyltransferase (adenine-specific)
MNNSLIELRQPPYSQCTVSRSTFYLGDCLEVLPLLPDGSVDLIYCDLPFGTTQCSWDNVIPFDKMWEQVKRIAKHNTPIVFHSQQPFTSNLIMSNPKMFKYTWVWEKSKATGFLNAKKRPLVAHEDIIVFCKGTPVYYPQMTQGEAYNKGVRKQQTDNDVYGKFEQVEVKSDGLRYPRSVQYFKTAESEGQTFHKTEKPIDLCKYIIQTYTMEGQTVLDFTMGSNKSGLACEMLNRNFIGIESDAEHFATSIRRVSEYCG